MFHPEGPSFIELTIQALSSTRRGYDLLAPKFDHTPFRTPNALLEPLIATLGPPASLGAALDVCCGTGAAMRLLRPLCKDHITGLDFSPGMLDEARRRVSQAPGTAEVRLVQGDALAMEFEQEFDAAISCGAFGHFEAKDHDRFIAGIFRALKPGGRFVSLARRPLTPRDSTWWMYRGFNAVMRVRNAVVKPEFISTLR